MNNITLGIAAIGACLLVTAWQEYRRRNRRDGALMAGAGAFIMGVRRGTVPAGVNEALLVPGRDMVERPPALHWTGGGNHRVAPASGAGERCRA
jgi:hypothetical protein